MRIATFDQITKTKFALFGLPFTLSGALLASCWPSPMTWLWIVLGFFFARTSGMAFNQLIDRYIDRLNPRTHQRPLALGVVKPQHVAILAWTSLALFLLVCSQINRAVFSLSPIAAFLIWGYSYTKRFTHLCHFVIGAVQCLGPVMAYAAVTNAIALPPFLLGVANLACIAGGDIMYAIQDLSFDRKYKLHSIPARFGEKRARLIAQGLQSVAVVMLIVLGFALNGGPIFWMGAFAVASLFFYSHLRSFDFARCNMQVACTVLIAILGDLLWRVL